MVSRQEAAAIAMQDTTNPVVQGLMSLLLKYGHHRTGLDGPSCMVYITGTCDCGWEELNRDLQGAVHD